MESVESMSEGEWSSFNGMYNTTEEADFMAQLLANPPMPSVIESCSSLGVRPHFWPGHDSIMSMAGTSKSVFCSSDIANTNWLPFSRKKSFSGSNSSFFTTPTSSSDNYANDSHPTSGNNNIPMLMEFFNEDAKNATSYLTQGDECMGGCNVDQETSGDQPGNDFPNKESMDIGMKSDIPVVPSPGEDTNAPEIKRRPRTAETQKNKRNIRTRRNQKHSSAASTEEENNAGANPQNASTSSSDDDSNGSQSSRAGISPNVSSKENPAASKLNGKSRASRGTATDPQSLYARKRRERINERLKVLQSLVPNGTKVDISTMLEEAVQYVKFLQLQIKLLSSDDLWMYAPIAYNGMSLGLDLNIPIPPKRS